MFVADKLNNELCERYLPESYGSTGMVNVVRFHGELADILDKNYEYGRTHWDYRVYILYILLRLWIGNSAIKLVEDL